MGARHPAHHGLDADHVDVLGHVGKVGVHVLPGESGGQPLECLGERVLHVGDPHTPLVFYKGALGGFLAAD